MRRRHALAAMVLAATGAPATAAGPHRIGVLIGSAEGSLVGNRVRQAFHDGMRAQGYVEGRDLIVEWRYAHSNVARMTELVHELVQLKVEVIAVFTTPTALEAKQATKTIPIVFAGVSDPVGSGVVSNLAKPEANLTGVSGAADIVVIKHLDILRAALPGIKRLAVLLNPDNHSYAKVLPVLQGAAGRVGIAIDVLHANSVQQLEAAFFECKRKGMQAMMVFDDSLFMVQRVSIAQLAIRTGIPTIANAREFADGGFLFSYGEPLAGQIARSAVYVDKILRGATPRELPVEQPIVFPLTINRKTARALGLNLDTAFLLRADEVIE